MKNITIATFVAFACFALSGCIIVSAQKAPTTKITLHLDQEGAVVSPTFYGLMTEEINFSYEGGLYAQLLRNPQLKDAMGGNRRGAPQGQPRLQGVPKVPGWAASDSVDAAVSLDRNIGAGLPAAQTTALLLDAKAAGKSVVNEGFWGIPVKPSTAYKGGFFAKTDASGTIFTVQIESLDGNTVYAKTQVTGVGSAWRRYQYTLTTAAGVTPTKDTQLRIIADKAGKHWFAYTTLFPPTFNNRPNGLRVDLMQMLKDLKPTFLRFPGGNYLEGNTFADRFDWKKTIGDPANRAGHNSPWGYRSTDGLGLMEFLLWAEDIGAEPVLGVFAGYVLNRDHLEAGPFLQPFVDDAIDEIEYCIGSTSTKWGAVRARDGHSEPFPLKYVEIGNEDWFDGSGSYTGRYKQFYEAIKAKYPQLEIISTIGRGTSMANTMMDIPGVQVDIIDEHYYRNATEMFRNANQYDTYPRDGAKVFCGEWATREGSPTPNMGAALGDAAWMTCMERNSDIVIMHCYAPLLVNVNPGGMQWSSDLIGYDALNSYASPPYWAQWLFSNYLGNKVVPITATDVPTFETWNERSATVPALYYVATKCTDTGNVFLKVVNASSIAQTAELAFDGKAKIQSKALKVELKGNSPEDTNTITDPNNIAPVKSEQKVGKKFKYSFPAHSITVLQVATK